MGANGSRDNRKFMDQFCGCVRTACCDEQIFTEDANRLWSQAHRRRTSTLGDKRSERVLDQDFEEVIRNRNPFTGQYYLKRKKI